MRNEAFVLLFWLHCIGGKTYSQSSHCNSFQCSFQKSGLQFDKIEIDTNHKVANATASILKNDKNIFSVNMLVTVLQDIEKVFVGYYFCHWNCFEHFFFFPVSRED